MSLFAGIRSTAERITAEKWRVYHSSLENGLYWWQTDAARDDWRTFARGAQSPVERETFGMLLRKVVLVKPVMIDATPHQQRLAMRAAIVPRGRQNIDTRRAVVLWSDLVEKGRPSTSAFFEEGHEAVTVTTHGYTEKPQKVRVPIIVFHNTYSAPPFQSSAAQARGRAETSEAAIARRIRSQPRGKLWRDGKLVEDTG